MARMLAKLARRGPEADGQHADGPVRLGHRRLAIIDLPPSSKQRMLDASSGTALVFNGTLYNYPGLRAELIGCGLFPIPTAIPKPFCVRMWNVERLYGMFAFAIWSRETLFLARDRLGIKLLLQ